jgi:adenylylsulfate kinase-like enzyme
MTKQYKSAGGVIWITGFSASGKTSVGREVQQMLQRKNMPVIFLDGDHLRAIFGDKWGYSNAERVELSKVHLKLSSHLSKQGYTVILSAVAMYKDTREWAKEHIPSLLYVLLDVPLELRLERDKHTKKIYSSIGQDQPGYDFQLKPDLVVENFGDNSSEQSAELIIQNYLQLSAEAADHGRSKYWSEYYARTQAPLNESPFAKFVNSKISLNSDILEIGCGNGRDSFFFSKNHHSVSGFDTSITAIEGCLLESKNSLVSNSINFCHDNILSFSEKFPDFKFDLIYCRFTFNAMTLAEELEFLSLAPILLKNKGKLFIECRSINDPLARSGEIVSATERVNGHYRRFIIAKELQSRLNAHGFTTEHFLESNGLSLHEGEDPVLIRICAKHNT